MHPRRAALLRSARAGGCTPGKPPSCLRQGRVRGRTGRAGPWPGWTGRLLAYGKGGSFVPAARWEHANVHGKPTLSARLTARRSCLFLRLVAGEASPAPPGRGLCPLLTLLRGALPPGPPKGVRDRTGQAALLPTARAGAWPHGTSRFLAYGKGGCVAARDRPPSCLRQGRVRGRTEQAAFLPTARAGVSCL